MKEKINFNRMLSAQVDVEPILAQNEAFELLADDFNLASDEEKANFIEMRKSMTYWQDAWRRLKKNQVAMVSLYIIAAIILFAFVGPLFSQYDYHQQVKEWRT
jgi:oligopeptide transport system permease protein